MRVVKHTAGGPTQDGVFLQRGLGLGSAPVPGPITVSEKELLPAPRTPPPSTRRQPCRVATCWSISRSAMAPGAETFKPVSASMPAARSSSGTVWKRRTCRTIPGRQGYRRTSGIAEFAEADQPAVLGLYDGCVKMLDEEIERHLNLLEQLGLLENTLVVLTSDHGEQLLERGAVGHS